MLEKVWITDIAALNAIVDAARKVVMQPDNFSLLALRQSIDRAENGMKWDKEFANEKLAQ